MTKLFGVTFMVAALATYPALARGGIAIRSIAHPGSHASSPTAHAVVNAFQGGLHPHDSGFRRPGPIVIVVGGSYVDQHDAYCAENYPKYDPASETYLGDDGQRYLCPEFAE